LDIEQFTIVPDPGPEGFYLNEGALRIGEATPIPT